MSMANFILMASFCSAFRKSAKNEYFNQSLSKWVSGKKKKRKDKTDAKKTNKKKQKQNRDIQVKLVQKFIYFSNST